MLSTGMRYRRRMTLETRKKKLPKGLGSVIKDEFNTHYMAVQLEVDEKAQWTDGWTWFSRAEIFTQLTTGIYHGWTVVLDLEEEED